LPYFFFGPINLYRYGISVFQLLECRFGEECALQLPKSIQPVVLLFVVSLDISLQVMSLLGCCKCIHWAFQIRKLVRNQPREEAALQTWMEMDDE